VKPRKVAILTAGGLAPCLSSAIGGLIERYTEIAPEIDADPRAMYWRQVRNGMWIRAALILTIFERDAEVARYYLDLTS